MPLRGLLWSHGLLTINFKNLLHIKILMLSLHTFPWRKRGKLNVLPPEITLPIITCSPCYCRKPLFFGLPGRKKTVCPVIKTVLHTLIYLNLCFYAFASTHTLTPTCYRRLLKGSSCSRKGQHRSSENLFLVLFGKVAVFWPKQIEFLPNSID